MTDDELYASGMRTAAACWAAFARVTPGAAVHHPAHAAVAVFPTEPERPIYNNAILACGLASAQRAAALEAMEELYAASGVGHFAAWVRESDHAMHDELRRRGYTVDTSTRAMAMPLDGLSLQRPDLDLVAPEWREHLRLIDAPSTLLDTLDPTQLHLLVARSAGVNVATGFGFDHEGDCGIYNVGTLERVRRRGIGSALTARLVYDAIGRGCRTASLQSTPAAERMYAAVGFRDLGRIIEYVPRRRTIRRAGR